MGMGWVGMFGSVIRMVVSGVRVMLGGWRTVVRGEWVRVVFKHVEYPLLGHSGVRAEGGSSVERGNNGRREIVGVAFGASFFCVAASQEDAAAPVPKHGKGCGTKTI